MPLFSLAELEAAADLVHATMPPTPPTLAGFPLNRLSGAFTGLLDILQDADMQPTSQAMAANRDLQTSLRNARKTLDEIKAEVETKGYK